ncbi:hypothetical protein [Paraglaciecola sp. 20A4]|uniref:hypothetical protein n=1 Tax=Paraglaciecola sp. 20A4 TaxID=2687288 RepID=UPI00140B1E21|nr:hypothetical protein [Paraglaciecola sp. 20A4]
MFKRKKGGEQWWLKTGFLQGMGAALIAGVIAIGLHLTKNDSAPAEQICNGDDCIQVGESSGTININTKKESPEDEPE